MKVVLKDMLWIRQEDWSRDTVQELKQRFTVTPRRLPDGELPSPIRQYVTRGGLLGLPAYAGKQWARGMGATIVNKTSSNRDALLHTCAIPTPRDEVQRVFFDDIVVQLSRKGYLLAQADTGTGKTVAGIHTAAIMGEKTLIVVPTRRLALQWVKQIKRHTGLTSKHIGMVQGGAASYVGKTFVVAVVHNLTEVRFPPDFYTHFGFVIYDEVHNYGARWFSKSLSRLHARYQLALTATAYRADGCEVIFKNKFGPVRVRGESLPMSAVCYVCPVKYPLSKEKARLNNLPRNALLYSLRLKKSRNELIVSLAYKLWKKGRQLVVMADSVKHLQKLGGMLITAGIPKKQIGLYARSYYVGKKKKMIGQGYLDRMEKERPVLLATYGLMREGVDIPRLDAGIEASPRSDNVQAIGRIRRWLTTGNKPLPVWYSLQDEGIDLLENVAHARFNKFKENGILVKQWKGELAA